MNQRFRDYLAAAVGIIALTLGSLALVIGRVDYGVTFVVHEDIVVIDSVAENSPARRQGLDPGMVVVSLNGTQLIRLPQYVCPEGAVDCGDIEPPTLEPATPEPIPFDATGARLINGQVVDLHAIPAADLEDYRPGEQPIYSGGHYLEVL